MRTRVGYETNGGEVAPIREWYARTGKLVSVLTRYARFRENTGFWPPRDGAGFLRHALLGVSSTSRRS